MLLFKVDSFGFVTLFAIAHPPMMLLKTTLPTAARMEPHCLSFLLPWKQNRGLPSREDRKSALFLAFGSGVARLLVFAAMCLKLK